MTMPGRDRRARAPLPAPLSRALGVPLAYLYSAALARINRRADLGAGVTTLAVPVISVGNLSVGGTGKTPMVMALATAMLREGLHPCIAMRGYKSRKGEPGDEAREYADRLPTVPVVAQPDRAAGVRALLRTTAIDCVILDDGFQHRAIARDFDIVLLDATRDVFADRCLPAGWLREPVSSLVRADAAVFTHTDQVPSGALNAMHEKARAINDHLLIATARHTWDHLRVGGDRRDVDWLNGRQVVAACGIGNPGAFFDQVDGAGAIVAETWTLPDHHAWTPADAERLTLLTADASAEAIVVTAKGLGETFAPSSQGIVRFNWSARW